MGIAYANMLATTQWPLERAAHLTSLVWVCVLWLPESLMDLSALCLSSLSHLVMEIICSWWLHIKLIHCRMSVGYHEWHGVLFISVWRASGCSTPSRELCCLDVETGNRACTNSPFWYCVCSSLSLGLNWRRSHIYRIEIGDMRIAAQC